MPWNHSKRQESSRLDPIQEDISPHESYDMTPDKSIKENTEVTEYYSL